MKRIGSVIAFVIAFMTGCGDDAGDTPETDSLKPRELTYASDPRDGWVRVEDVDYPGYTVVLKRCDGTTLMYTYRISHGGGISVVRDSPECTPK